MGPFWTIQVKAPDIQFQRGRNQFQCDLGEEFQWGPLQAIPTVLQKQIPLGAINNIFSWGRGASKNFRGRGGYYYI